MRKYKKEFVVLVTDEGTATDKNHLIEMWKRRTKKFCSHYKVLTADIIQEVKKGKRTWLSKREVKGEILSRMDALDTSGEEYSDEDLLNDFEEICKKQKEVVVSVR